MLMSMRALASAGSQLSEQPRSWDDIPGVAFIGIMIGVVLLAAAIRGMFKRGK